METQNIQKEFDNIANEYDLQRRKFIPCFDDYYLTMINFIEMSVQKPNSILDLGAGTGLLTNLFYERFPDSKYTLTDISEQMLKVAKKRFSDLKKFKFQIADYTKEIPEGVFDIVVSGLSIHHLCEKDKKRLYINIYKQLPINGWFINFDQFNAESEMIDKMYNTWWYNYIEQSDLPKVEHEKWLRRRELDQENSIGETIKLLKDAGFQIAECIYSFMKFGVIIAKKIN